MEHYNNIHVAGSSYYDCSRPLIVIHLRAHDKLNAHYTKQAIVYMCLQSYCTHNNPRDEACWSHMARLIMYDWSKSIVLYTSGWLVNGVAKQEVALGCESTSKEYPKETGKILNVCVAKKTAWLRLR